MLDETGKSSAIRNYLLGDLPESGAEELERWYFADGQRVDEVWAVFSEMAEDYLSGDFSESESRRFRRRLRSAPALRELFENEKALCNYAARTAAETSRRAETDNSIPEVGWRRSAHVGFLNLRRLAVACVLVLTAFIAWFALRMREGAIPVSPEGSQQTRMKDQRSPGGIAQPSVYPERSSPSGRDANDNRSDEKNSSDASSTSQGRPEFRTDQMVTATFLLSRPRVREEQNDPILEISVQTGDIQLELELSNDACAVYSAALHAESGEPLQRWERLRARRDHSIPRVALRAPANSLKNASYVIRLDCISHPVPAEHYRFKVEKK
jgi:hypothetical protein